MRGVDHRWWTVRLVKRARQLGLDVAGRVRTRPATLIPCDSLGFRLGFELLDLLPLLLNLRLLRLHL